MGIDEKYAAATNFIAAYKNLEWAELEVRSLKEKLSKSEELLATKSFRFNVIPIEIWSVDQDREYDYDDRNVRNMWFKKRGALERERNVLWTEIQKLENEVTDLKTRLKEAEDKVKEAEEVLVVCDSALAATFEKPKKVRSDPSQPGGPN